MKKILILLSAFFLFCTTKAQDFSYKYGSISDEELSMSVYPGDSSAKAVVLFDDMNVFYKHLEKDFCLVSECKRRIKILSTEGTEHANINIPFYSPSDISARGEQISGIEAFVYNLEDGKIQKVKMDKKLIFEERVNAYWKQMKFSIPSVRAGSVIEYKYVSESQLYHTIPDWIVQRDVPVAYAHLKVSIPEYFIFNAELHGYHEIKVDESSELRNFSVATTGMNTQSVSSTCKVLDLKAKEIPAIREEPYIWSQSDFISRVAFELNGTNFGTYKPYTNNWKEIEKLLNNDSDFGGKLKMDNPFKEELREILGQQLAELSRIRAIYALVKSKIRWNEKYGFYGDKLKAALKNGVGNNADINFLLLAMLRDAGVRAYPVLLSRRSLGRLPFSYPSLSKLNTFVVGIKLGTGDKVYLDGSAVNGDINILPPDLLVDKAREYGAADEHEWVDLRNIGNDRVAIILEASIAPDGLLAGKYTFLHKGQFAAGCRNKYREAGDSVAYKAKMQTELGADILELNVIGIDSVSSSVNEKGLFAKRVQVNGDYIYLPAMLFPHITKNPFTLKERMFPVEFSYPYQFRILCSLRMPEGYRVEEVPKSLKLNMSEDACKCLYVIDPKENMIVVSYTFTMNRTLYSQQEYADLKNVWEMLVAKNTEQIVLKKM